MRPAQARIVQLRAPASAAGTRADGSRLQTRLARPLPGPSLYPELAATSDSEKDSWLMSYMDILTLLLTLFVVLLAFYSVAPTDGAKPASPVVNHAAVTAAGPTPDSTVATPAPVATEAQAAQTPQAADGATPTDATKTSPDAVTIIAATATADPGPKSAAPAPTAEADTSLTAATSEPHDDAKTPPATRAANERLAALLAAAANGAWQVSAADGLVRVDLQADVLFASASAEIEAQGRATLEKLAQSLRDQPFGISVEGHTDDIPMSGGRYASNWELSAARASNVTRTLIANGIAAQRLRAVGLADTAPVKDNSTAEGRAANRRVSFVIQSRLDPTGK